MKNINRAALNVAACCMLVIYFVVQSFTDNVIEVLLYTFGYLIILSVTAAWVSLPLNYFRKSRGLPQIIIKNLTFREGVMALVLIFLVAYVAIIVARFV